VRLPESVLHEHDIASVELSVGAGLTLVPAPKPGDAAQRLTAADIEDGAGRLRNTAIAIVDRDEDKAHASQVLARLIDDLPRRGRASLDVRTGIWASAGQPVAANLAQRGVHRARSVYNSCYRKTRLGDLTLRECLGTAHDAFMQDLNEDYWKAVRTGT